MDLGGGGVGYIMGRSLRCFLVVGGGGVMKVFSCHLTEISTPLLLANSLKYYQKAFSYQAELPGVKS